MIYLLPQITKEISGKIITEIAKKGVIENYDMISISNIQEGISYTPTGGRRVSSHELYSLREKIINLSKQYGYDNKNSKNFLEFEYKLAILFKESSFLWHKGYPTGEALRNDFWSYFTIVLLPDIATWRWGFPENGEPTKAWSDRMLGGTRNTFQRVFKRVISFDKGVNDPNPLSLINELLEDDFSAILERSSLGGNSSIAICLAEEFLEMRKRWADKSKKVQTEIYRKATKDLTAFGKVQSLDILDHSDLKKLISNIFNKIENQIKIN
tara:strand:- start:270 stop:1076 length:807 start_codon:yes stop_codon:yes gene_type:complete